MGSSFENKTYAVKNTKLPVALPFAGGEC